MHGQMVSRWAEVLGRDPQVAPSVGIVMCTHAAWLLKFQEGGCTVPKHLQLCVSFVVLQCLAQTWHACGLAGTSSEFGVIGLRRQMYACLEINGFVGCVPRTVHLFLHNV
jgi:hypothetical protein